jgi:hypothetical protein
MMRSTVGRVGGGAFVVLGFLALFAAVRTFRQITPLPERADVPGGFAVLFVTLLFLVGLGLLAVGTALLGSGADWVGRRARSVFRTAGYLVAGSLPAAVLSVFVAGELGIGVLVVTGAALLGALVVLLGLVIGVASVAYRSVAG